MSNGQTTFFGPDLSRGPVSSYRIETAAVQIATTLAQLRAPLGRSADDLRNHADFIRELADRLAPDWAAQVALDVGEESGNEVVTSIRAAIGTYGLLDCWLCDTVGAGLTTTAPYAVDWLSGTVLETVVAKKRYRVITPTSGVVSAKVTQSGTATWRWAVSRHGRVYYSSPLQFT